MNLKSKFILVFILSVLGLFYFSNYSYAQNQKYGGLKNDIPSSIAITENGQIVLAGFTKNFDDGSDQAYVMKLNQNGDVLWENTYGNKYFDRFYDVCINKDKSVVLTGETWLGFGDQYGPGQMIMVHLDPDGNLLKHKSFYLYHRDFGMAVKEVVNGGHIVVGFTKSMTDIYGDIMVVRVNQDLDTLWMRVLGDPFSVDYGFDVIENEAGFMIFGSLGGFFKSVQSDFRTEKSRIYVAQISKQGELIWQKKFGGGGHNWVEQVVANNDGIYMIGCTQSMGNGSFDMLLMKIDQEGDSLWSESFGGVFYEQGRSIVIQEDRIYFGGQKKKDTEEIGSEIYLVCTDLDGMLIWEKTISSSESDQLKEMVLSPDGNSILCVAQSEDFENNKDFWLFSLDTSGSFFSIPDIDFDHHLVYPNPVSSVAYINVDNPSASKYELYIYNTKGQLVEQSESTMMGNIFRFSTSDLAVGFYTYRLIIGEKKSIQGKFIVYR